MESSYKYDNNNGSRFRIREKEILKRYKVLLRSVQGRTNLEDRKIIRKAFDLAVESHKDMRRKSGEPYIYHPIAVAQICADEIGLGATAIVCALLHDVVEDTEITIEDIKRQFGEKPAMIIDGLTKISGVFDQRSSQQAENFRKMLLTLSDDVRVILIKLADRLHNMRTLDSMARDKQLKIASETLYMYAPLAHRLGLYAIKTELEDLGLKYTEPDTYQEIVDKLKNTEDVRKRFINRFTMPIKKALAENGLDFEVKGRPKSVFSIWNKVTKKGVPFEEIYDIFAIRIIVESKPENEKADCWKVYSMVTDFYKPSPERLRDWISTPRANGYESLHTTVMSPTGKWVEVQIRTRRMDDIAEKGYAAHWLYKEGSKNSSESNIDSWLKRIREMIENSDGNALEFIDEFKLNLFSEEIFIFTPKGELKTLPANSTALDFAYEVHSQIGNSCIGAKVNNKLVPLSYPLKSGDQIEIITSSKQRPKEDWLGYVVTAKAKGRIKSALKEEKRAMAEEGRAMLERKLNHLKLKPDGELLNRLAKNYKVHSVLDLFHDIAIGQIDLKTLPDYLEEKKKHRPTVF
ncbi:MAG: RelA/SpoT family protein [Sphingobacteriales bacterium JAD_PAG50586_3]|nr:MAG: RelA/SpoT family protein [Sphingobacteriales bacterium JAD_PAG50586_3]